MAKLKFQATKMSEAQVSHISLVERGANRIPFKIIKQETQGMSKAFAGIDLGTLFARKADKPKPELVGVVAMKGEGLESIKKQLMEAGFDVAACVEAEDGSVVFKQGNSEIEGTGTVIRMNDEVAVVMKGFAPYNMDITSEDVSFADMCAAQGFYPGISTIMEVLANSVRSIVYGSDSPAQAKADVAKIFSEASAYTASFLNALPQKAFKLENVLAQVTEKGEEVKEPVAEAGGATGATTEAEDGVHAEGTEATGTAESEVVKGEGSGQSEKAPEAPQSLTEEKVSAIVTTNVAKAVSGFEQAMTSMTATLETVQEAVAGIAAGLKEVSDRVEKAETLATSVQKSVQETVVIGSEVGDDNPIQKSETYHGRDIDTAYTPRRKYPGR